MTGTPIEPGVPRPTEGGWAILPVPRFAHPANQCNNTTTLMKFPDAACHQDLARHDDGYEIASLYPPQHRLLTFQPVAEQAFWHSYPSLDTSFSLPDQPELLRSGSYEPQISSNDPSSSLMRSMDFACTHGVLSTVDGLSTKPLASFGSGRSTAFEANSNLSVEMPSVREQPPRKRYPCRCRDSHGCERTFTTSGHATRHSRIHTGDKNIQCTYPGCGKTFTRPDNMKQHVATHYKGSGHSSGGARANKTTHAKARRKSTASGNRRTITVTTTAGDTRGLNTPIPQLGRPVAARSLSSGLDALVMAVECQARSS
ncbi:transcriptional regulator family: C2H2 zinc finger [Purpureocillium lilacinum]|uniref:C2H2 type master regulator of conidiophore development brlA n=1 Tax=Purpureocillium lilacinum TaxID=33203 RepID=A0ABR0BFR8_PURLI|nr:transcriptional regulator family: C2H2 zinc finger [Purpureocillium lilacinum]